MRCLHYEVVFWIICVRLDRGSAYLEDMSARLVRYAQDSVRVPMGVPTTPTRTVWKPVQGYKEEGVGERATDTLKRQ